MQKNAKNVVKNMCLNALFVGVYIALVYAFGDLSFGFANGLISFRVAEILIVLCCFNKNYIYGAILACFCANLIGGLPIDIIVGTIQTAITVLILAFFKNKQIAVILGALACGVIIGLELYFLQLSAIGLWIILTVFVGELIILEIGYLLFKKYKDLIDMRNNL